MELRAQFAQPDGKALSVSMSATLVPGSPDEEGRRPPKNLAETGSSLSLSAPNPVRTGYGLSLCAQVAVGAAILTPPECQAWILGDSRRCREWVSGWCQARP